MLRRLFYLLSSAAVAVALLAPTAAQSHNSPAHWFGIQANSGVVTYVDVFTGHCCWYMNSESTWSSVGDTCGYLHYVQFYYYNIGFPAPEGGPVWVSSGGWGVGPYYPDYGRAPYYSAGWSAPVEINSWICGGQANGRLAAITTKHNANAGCNPCGTHQSETAWYRP